MAYIHKFEILKEKFIQPYKTDILNKNQELKELTEKNNLEDSVSKSKKKINK